MLDDVTVIAWGEFGRTPTINKDAGRDHWPKVSCAILAGGGMPHRAGNRGDESTGRICRAATSPLPGDYRHTLPQYRDRPEFHSHHRSGRPTATPSARRSHS